MTLTEVADKIAIAEHTAFYNECWDDGHVDDWVATWTPDGRFVLPGAPDTVGHEALHRMIAAMAPARLVHLTMNPRIDLHGDTADHTCAVVLATRDPSRAPDTSRWLTAGRYRDQLVRTADGWRFAVRTFRPDASLGGLPKWW